MLGTRAEPADRRAETLPKNADKDVAIWYLKDGIDQSLRTSSMESWKCIVLPPRDAEDDVTIVRNFPVEFLDNRADYRPLASDIARGCDDDAQLRYVPWHRNQG